MARIFHPDRVHDSFKNSAIAAKEKFTILHQVYTILANPESKRSYDAGEEILLSVKTTIAGKWERYIRTIDSNDIIEARIK